MTEREEEITFLLKLIDKFCNKYNVTLILKDTVNDGKCLRVIDNVTGKEYTVTRKD